MRPQFVPNAWPRDESMQLVPRASRWSPSRRKKSGQIAISRHTNSQRYCPQQRRAMRAYFGLTQADCESDYNTPFLSSLSFQFFFFFHLTCGWRAYAQWYVGTTRYLCRRSLVLFVPLYCRLLWCTGDVGKKTPITMFHRLIHGEHELAFSRSLIVYYNVIG